MGRIIGLVWDEQGNEHRNVDLSLVNQPDAGDSEEESLADAEETQEEPREESQDPEDNATEEGGVYSCPVCGRKYKTAERLSKHVMDKHAPD